jgi:hypothetical protein
MGDGPYMRYGIITQGIRRPETKPLQVVSILHGHRNVERILKGRF